MGRAVVGMTLRGTVIAQEEGSLTEETRRELERRVLERLDDEESYEVKKYKMRSIIQRQARRVVTYLRGEGKYKPFTAGW